MKTRTIQIGDLVTVRGIACKVFKIHPAGTIDVEEINGQILAEYFKERASRAGSVKSDAKRRASKLSLQRARLALKRKRDQAKGDVGHYVGPLRTMATNVPELKVVA